MRFAAWLTRAALIAAVAMIFGPVIALAQQYPVANPTYIPSAILPVASLAAPGDITMQLNGIGSVVLDVAGTNTGVAAVVQGTNSRGASPTWKALGCLPLGGASGEVQTITGNVTCRLSVTGLAQLRFHMTAISTGSVAVSMAGTQAAGIVGQASIKRATYSASTTAFAPAASATDFLTLKGSATTTVRIDRVACSGTSTAPGKALVVALVRSTADTGTPVALTAVPHDSSDPAATALAGTFAANPTTGTLIGNVRSAVLELTDGTIAAPPLVWDFGTEQRESLTLRGVAQQFALNGNGASFPTGAALSCSVEWDEIG